MTRRKRPTWPSTVAVIVAFLILIALLVGMIYVGMHVLELAGSIMEDR